MNVYSTCRDCGGLLHVTSPDDTVHPGCTPKPTKVERLTQEWLAAAAAGDDGVADGLEQLITELDTRPPRLLDAALLYASWGWPVFPLRQVGGRCDGDDKCARRGVCQCPKKPATRNGFKDATTDPKRIRSWWTRHPRANIGLPTGHAFDVIDIDVPDGIPSYLKLLDADDEVHGQAITSSGGVHLYRKPQKGRGNGARIMPGVDYRGMGGYVVAPPSTLGPRGRSWAWVHRPSPVISGAGDTYGR